MFAQEVFVCLQLCGGNDQLRESTSFDLTVDEGRGRLNPGREKPKESPQEARRGNVYMYKAPLLKFGALPPEGDATGRL